MNIPLLYRDNNVIVPEATLIVEEDDKKKIGIYEKKERSYDIKEKIDSLFVEEIYNSIMEDIVVSPTKEDNYVVKPSGQLHVYRIKNTIIETNLSSIILDNDIIYNAVLLDDYVKSKFTTKNNPRNVVIRFIGNTHGFVSVYIVINNVVFGPILYDEVLSGYLDYHFNRFTVKEKKNYIPFMRVIEYKKLFFFVKENNNIFIIINGMKYKITTKKIKYNNGLITFAYARLKKKMYKYIEYDNIHNVDFDIINFYDYKQQNIFDIHYNDVGDNIKMMNLIAYLFPFSNRYRTYKECYYINNLNVFYKIDDTYMLYGF